jgi:malonate transporter
VLPVLLVTFPFFALVLAGYIAARRGMLPLEAIPGLNALRAVFRAAVHAVPLWLDHADRAVAGPGAVFHLPAVRAGDGGFVVAVSMNERIGWNDAAFGALVAAFPNTGFMGVPLLVALLGRRRQARPS